MSSALSALGAGGFSVGLELPLDNDWPMAEIAEFALPEFHLASGAADNADAAEAATV